MINPLLDVVRRPDLADCRSIDSLWAAFVSIYIYIRFPGRPRSDRIPLVFNDRTQTMGQSNARRQNTIRFFSFFFTTFNLMDIRVSADDCEWHEWMWHLVCLCDLTRTIVSHLRFIIPPEAIISMRLFKISPSNTANRTENREQNGDAKKMRENRKKLEIVALFLKLSACARTTHSSSGR